MVRWIKVILRSFVLIATGFLAKGAVENSAIAEFLSVNTRWLVVGTSVFVLFTLLIFILVFWALPKWVSWKFGVALDKMSDETMMRGVADRVLFGSKAGEDLAPPEQQRIAILRLGMWFMRREAIHIYFSILVAIGGGVVGTATVYLLYHQNEKLEAQNTKLTLQTDATIIQALLLEGTRRATLQDQLANLLREVEAELNAADPENHEMKCSEKVNTACWETKREHPVYQLSSSLNERVSLYLNASAPYHSIISAAPEPAYDKSLRTQIGFGFGSPERSSVLRSLSRLNVSADHLNFEFSSVIRADLSGVNLEAARLTETNLISANLENANLKSTQFVRANLLHTNLSGAHLQWASMYEADLSNANFSGADLTRASLRFANLTDADLSGAVLLGADLGGAQLSGAVFSGAIMSMSDLTIAAATLAAQKQEYLKEVNLQGAWAWADRPPKIPVFYDVQVCIFDQSKHDRGTKPDGCF